MRLTIKTLFAESKDHIGKSVKVAGWVRSVRNSKAFSFIVLNDGSCQNVLQIVADAEMTDYAKVTELLIGSCIQVEGKLVESQGKGQSIEMQAQSVQVYGKADSTYPLQKKATSLEFLREQAHLRPRTNLFGAVFRVRHQLAMATHKFFDDRGFYYLNSPILTAVDAEGAGEMFNVTNMDMANLPKNKDGSVDFSNDYFGKQASLCVTGQLEGECFAMGMGAVYTFGPTFRAENSNTPRHLSEFWMIEPEVAFADLEEDMDLAEKFIKYLIQYALDNCMDDLQFLSKRLEESEKGKKAEERSMELIAKLRFVLENDFERITYTQAIDILKNSKPNKKKKFQYLIEEWGADLQSEHERFLVEKHFKKPVILTDYPANIKAFYMKQNEDGKTVRAMDVLFPQIGEIIGGSQREDDLDKLVERMKALDIPEEDMWWYIDLRKFGSVVHSGFGLGFERLMLFVTGMTNIRDVIPFPRTPQNAEF